MVQGCSRTVRIWLYLLTLICYPVITSAQVKNLKVTFNSTTIDRSVSYRDTSAGFSHWIMSLITIKDQDSSYVHGLASRDRWLLPTDSTDLDTAFYENVLVDSVWRHVYEYHVGMESYPGDPDVKHLEQPPYMVTEVTDVGVTLVLVMDYSGSVSPEDRKIAEDAARSLVNRMHTNDKAAIIKFTGKVEVFQNLTSNKTLLLEAIARPVNTDEFTSFFDAVYKGIDLCKDLTDRKVVIAYSDGADNHSSHTKTAVINHSIENQVPVYIAGIGVDPNPPLHDLHTSNMEDIALVPGLGGKYYADTQLEQLESLYAVILESVSGYYVLATRSTDPYYNGTWRWVDIGIRVDDEAAGSGRGKYQVPNLPVDISVTKTVDAELNGSGQQIAAVNDTLTYTITVINHGSNRPDLYGPVNIPQARLVDMPSDSLLPGNFSTNPHETYTDSLVWHLPVLRVGQPLIYQYKCFIDTMKTENNFPLTNSVRVAIAPIPDIPTQEDTVAANNTDSQTVYYSPPSPPNIGVIKTGTGDYTDNENRHFVFRRDTAHYTVTISNTGNWDAENIEVSDLIPDSVIFLGSPFWSAPDDYTLSADGDTLRWTIPRLNTLQDTTFTYDCLVDSTPPWAFMLSNTVTTRFTFDQETFTDTSNAILWVEGSDIPDPIVAVSRPVIEPGDTITFRVMSPIPINRGDWELEVIYADDSVNDTYFQSFIDVTDLPANSWIFLPTFTDTRMVLENQKEETISVRLITSWEEWQNVIFTADTSFKVLSPEVFYLSQNVFRTGETDTLGMRFKLNTNRFAEIKIYDVSGGYVNTVHAEDSWAGINRTTWDGTDMNGLPVGSGLYVAILISGDFKKARKFILVR